MRRWSNGYDNGLPTIFFAYAKKLDQKGSCFATRRKPLIWVQIPADAYLYITFPFQVLKMISVIIPALNEEKYIENCLKALKNQTYKDFEIIIVDGNSTDNTIKITKKYVKVITSDKRGIGHQQNIGAKHARGNILVFIQADCILSKNTLEEINKTMKKDIVGGSIIGIYEPLNYKIKILNIFAPLLQQLLKMTYGFCTFTRKDIFKKISGYKNIICEDTELGFRLKKVGKVVILKNCSYRISSRRLIKKGFFPTIYLWVKVYFMNKFKIYTPIEKYPVVR